MTFWKNKATSTELVPVDVIGNLPFIVRRDHRIVAAFARKAAATDWAQSPPMTMKAASPCTRQPS